MEVGGIDEGVDGGGGMMGLVFVVLAAHLVEWRRKRRESQIGERTIDYGSQQEKSIHFDRAIQNRWA